MTILFGNAQPLTGFDGNAAQVIDLANPIDRILNIVRSRAMTACDTPQRIARTNHDDCVMLRSCSVEMHSG